jgi:hypothetical protein
MDRIAVLMLLGALAGVTDAEEPNPFEVQPTVVAAPQAWASSPYDSSSSPGPATGPETLKWRAKRVPAPVDTGRLGEPTYGDRGDAGRLREPTYGYPPPALVPLAGARGMPPPVVTYRPVLPAPTPPAAYYLGYGILGQPKVYLPGQPVQNFLRWLTP